MLISVNKTKGVAKNKRGFFFGSKGTSVTLKQMTVVKINRKEYEYNTMICFNPIYLTRH